MSGGPTGSKLIVYPGRFHRFALAKRRRKSKMVFHPRNKERCCGAETVCLARHDSAKAAHVALTIGSRTQVTTKSSRRVERGDGCRFRQGEHQKGQATMMDSG